MMSTTEFSAEISKAKNRPENDTRFIHFNQTNSSYELASVPVSGLTYTLFGLSCFIACIGLAGNFSILTVSFKHRRDAKSHDVLITVLAVTDIIALVTVALMQPCVYESIGVDLRSLTTIGCKVFMSVLYSTMFCSSTVIVLVSIERFLAVWCPIKSRKFLSRQTALRSVCVCATTIVIISSSMSVLYCERDENEICQPNPHGTLYSSVLKKMPDTTVYIAMLVLLSSPMLLLLILTPMTVIKLYKQNEIRRQLTSQERDDRSLKISVKLTSIVVVHLTLMVVPLAMSFTLVYIGKTVQGNGLSGIALAVLLNHSTNFLLYNTFDEEFRKRFYNLFGVGTQCG